MFLWAFANYVLYKFDDRSFNCRSGSSNGGGSVKLDGNSMSSSGGTRMTPKNDMEKISHPKDVPSGLNKERLLAKGNKYVTFIEPVPGSVIAAQKGILSCYHFAFQ